MKTLVPHPNVIVKIGGLNMTMTGLSAAGLPRPRSSIETARIQRDCILTAIDMFGPARCMFTSNFPVDMSNISWNVLWNAFKLVTAGFGSGERTDMFSEVALRIYRIARQDTSDKLY
jgi:predicted TIM-barrel fold metal-dependent hydrolase